MIIIGLLHPVAEKPLESTATVLHPLPKRPAESEQNIQFHSGRGSKATQKVDLFAEQNAKAEEKKAKAIKTRKRFLLIATPVLLAAIGGVIIFIICVALWRPKPIEPESALPTISDNSAEETTKVLQFLQSYENTLETEDPEERLEAINAVAEEILQYGNNSQYVEQINLAVIMFDVANGYYHELIEMSAKIDAANLPLDQKLIFYNSLALAYQALGDNAKSEEYFNLTNEASIELVGPGEFNEN